jgi:hypothetical protein
MKIFLLVVGFMFISNTYAFDKIYKTTLEDIEDLEIKVNGVKLNNFSFSEKKAIMAKGLVNIGLSFSVRNKNSSSKHFSVMFVGKSGEDTLWAISAEPSFSSVSENSTDTVKEDAYISSGTLAKTDSIWLRVVGDM